MGTLRIAVVINDVVPADFYGGTQRVAFWLGRELIRQGHSVTVVARQGSYVPGARMVCLAKGENPFAAVPEDTDIVHSHSGFPPRGFSRPSLTTIHGNDVGAKRGNWNFISRNHAGRYGSKTFVYNGFPVDEHYFSAHKTARYLFFSRINRAGKNVTKALTLARAHGFELDLAGGSRWELLTRRQVRNERAFFASFNPRLRFHGMVDGWEKARLFAEAKALLFPIRWEEPFGLVVIEALLAGTPVIATPRGSMPELLHPDVGFLCRDDADFAAAFEQVGEVDPRRCRDYAAENFSISKTTRQYVELYKRILDGETLP